MTPLAWCDAQIAKARAAIDATVYAEATPASARHVRGLIDWYADAVAEKRIEEEEISDH